jgi:hypothetical protein
MVIKREVVRNGEEIDEKMPVFNTAKNGGHCRNWQARSGNQAISHSFHIRTFGRYNSFLLNFNKRLVSIFGKSSLTMDE